MATKSLTFDIYGRDRNASKTIRGVGNEAEKTGGTFKRMGGVMVAGLALAGAAVIGFGVQSVKAFAEAEESQNKLAFAYEKFPALADTNIAAMRRLNTELAKKTRFDDDAYAVGQAQLAQYGLTGEQIMDLTPLLADFAGKTGKDLPTAAEALGKALLGNGRALKDVGIDFQDTGSVAGNFTSLMEGLRGQVGGFAEQDATTAAGRLDILRNKFGEVQEKIGEGLMPTLEGLVTWITDDGIPALEDLGKALQLDMGDSGKGPLIPNQDLFKRGVDTREGPARLLGQITDLFSNPAKVYDDISKGFGGNPSSVLKDWLPSLEEWDQYWRDNTTITVDGVAGVRGGMGGGFSGMGTDLDVFRAATGEKIGGTWTDANGHTQTGVGAVAASTGNGLMDVLGRVLGFSGQVGPQMGVGWAGANAATVTGWGGIQGSTAAGVGRVGTEVGRIPGVVQAPFGNAGSWLVGAGVDIVEGLIGGIARTVGDAAVAAANLAGAVIEAARNALDSHSPSRVFYDLGLDVGAGFDGGIEKAMGSSHRTIEAMVTAPSSSYAPRQSERMSLDGLSITGRLEIGGDGLARIIDGRIQARDEAGYRTVRAGRSA